MSSTQDEPKDAVQSEPKQAKPAEAMTTQIKLEKLAKVRGSSPHSRPLASLTRNSESNQGTYPT